MKRIFQRPQASSDQDMALTSAAVFPRRLSRPIALPATIRRFISVVMAGGGSFPNIFDISTDALPEAIAEVFSGHEPGDPSLSEASAG